MTIVFAILAVVFLVLFLVMFFKSQRLRDEATRQKNELASLGEQSEANRQHYETESLRIHNEAQTVLNQEAERIQKHYESEAIRIQTEAAQMKQESRAEIKQESDRIQAEIVRIQTEAAQVKQEAQAAISNARLLVDQHLAELKSEADRIRDHYETEARKSQEAAEVLLSKTLKELEPLRKYESLRDAEAEIKQVLADAMTEATALQKEAQALLEQSRSTAAEERSQAMQRSREIREKADAILDRATLDAGRIVEEANKRAEQIGGDAYVALRDKETLEQAVKALWNVTEGYGDRYVIPSRSLLDELAADFSHTDAGESLKSARDHTRRMVEQRQASACNYQEEDRRDRANRFVVDAFNGRVDALLTQVKHDNYGTLEQEIRDAFSVVNLNGLAFRDARILPAYLDSRLSELKWAVVVQELKRKEREEQRRIQEQIREEEKVRRERERAIKEAQEKEKAIEDALAKLRLEAEHSTAQERAKFDARIAELSQRLAEAEAVKQREISMAQLTRAGNVYIISNIGSFGEEVFKIGMTRRREPMDRIWELGDASVPFDFDVHAMIYSEDAPALERMLHDSFDDLRINKVNYRKEFFRLPLERIKEVVSTKGLNASFTLVAEAREFRETQALIKMTPEERERFHLRRESGDNNLLD